MSQNNAKKITASILIVLILILGSVIVLNYRNDVNSYKDTAVLVKEEIIDMQAIKNLNLEILSHQVEIIENTNSNALIIRQYSRKNLRDKEFFQTEQNGENLTLVTGKNRYISFDFGFLYRNSDEELIEIYLPSSIIESLNVDQGSGSLAFNTLEIKDVEISLGSGAIVGTSLISENLSIDTSSGKVQVDTLTGDGNIKISSGKNTFNSVTGTIDIKITSGKLELNSFKGQSNVEVSSGKVSMDRAEFTHKSAIDVTSGSVEIGVDSQALYCYDTHATSGKINTPDSACKDPNSIDITIDISSGKVTINDN